MVKNDKRKRKFLNGKKETIVKLSDKKIQRNSSSSKKAAALGLSHISKEKL